MALISSHSVLSLCIGTCWAVLLWAYQSVRGTVFEGGSLARSIVDVLIVGGGTGLALYSTHYVLSALVYGVTGYVLTGVLLLVFSRRD